MLFNVCLPRIGIPIPVAPLRSLASVTGVLEMYASGLFSVDGQ